MEMHGHGQLQSPLRRRWRAKRLRVVGKDSDSGPADSARALAPCPREWQPLALRIPIRVQGAGRGGSRRCGERRGLCTHQTML